MDKYKYVFAEKPEEGQNFWDVNDELANMTPYAQLLKKEGKRRGGRIMTAIWLVYDPKSRGSISGGRSEEELRLDIATNFLNEKKFDWGEYKDVIKAYKLDCKTKIERELDYWEIELMERREYIRQMDWEVHSKEKDNMLKNQKPLFKDYLEILKELDKERSEKRYYSGAHRSLLERQS
jgi:hypothetical protein